MEGEYPICASISPPESRLFLTQLDINSKTLQNIWFETDRNVIPLQLPQFWRSPFFGSFTITPLLFTLPWVCLQSCLVVEWSSPLANHNYMANLINCFSIRWLPIPVCEHIFGATYRTVVVETEVCQYFSIIVYSSTTRTTRYTTPISVIWSTLAFICSMTRSISCCGTLVTTACSCSYQCSFTSSSESLVGT